MFIDVITTDPRKPVDADPVKIDRINYYSARSREWLAKHCWWAMHNGLAVHTAPCDVVQG